MHQRPYQRIAVEPLEVIVEAAAIRFHPVAKQLRDTANTVEKLAKIGVEPKRMCIVLNRVDPAVPIDQQFGVLEAFLKFNPFCPFNAKCQLSDNEIYQRVKHDSHAIGELANDTTDFKQKITNAKTTEEKVKLADQLAIKRLAAGVLPELDACFAALSLV